MGIQKTAHESCIIDGEDVRWKLYLGATPSRCGRSRQHELYDLRLYIFSRTVPFSNYHGSDFFLIAIKVRRGEIWDLAALNPVIYSPNGWCCTHQSGP